MTDLTALYVTAGAIACWALARTVRANWTRIREALRG